MNLFVDALGPEAATMLAQLGRDEKAKVESEQRGRRGITPTTTVAIDGVITDNFGAVKADSVIFEYWDYRIEIVKACFDECRARSPVGPGKGGHYRDAFFCQLDGSGLPALELPLANALTAVERITITNPKPYARRLEVGVTEGGSSFVKLVDPHIMESAMEAVRHEFETVARLSFGYVDLSDAYVAKTNTFRRRPREKDRGEGVAIRYPAIFIDQA